MVPVTQYKVMVVSSSSLVKRRSTSPPQSLQARNFSTIQAASPRPGMRRIAGRCQQLEERADTVSVLSGCRNGRSGSV